MTAKNVESLFICASMVWVWTGGAFERFFFLYYKVCEHIMNEMEMNEDDIY